MEYRINRRTGDKISVIGFGASSLHEVSEKEAIETLKEAYKNGINYYDLASSDGKIFKYYGKAFEDVRENIMYQIHFGANFGGLAALLSMINSCSNCVSVVNINNGYGAGYIANQINKLVIK